MFRQLPGGPPLDLSRPGQESDRVPQKEMDVLSVVEQQKGGRNKREETWREGKDRREEGRERKEDRRRRNRREGKKRGRRGGEGRGENVRAYVMFRETATRPLFLIHKKPGPADFCFFSLSLVLGLGQGFWSRVSQSQSPDEGLLKQTTV